MQTHHIIKAEFWILGTFFTEGGRQEEREGGRETEFVCSLGSVWFEVWKGNAPAREALGRKNY
jgi:hypothetical protein